MAVSPIKVKAYATLVRAKLYILSETDREKSDQILIPEEYAIEVAKYLIA